MTAAILRLPAHAADCNAARAAVLERARHMGAPEATRQRAVLIAMRQLRRGASTGWAITQACRDLRGLQPAPRPDGAA